MTTFPPKYFPPSYFGKGYFTAESGVANGEMSAALVGSGAVVGMLDVIEEAASAKSGVRRLEDYFAERRGADPDAPNVFARFFAPAVKTPVPDTARDDAAAALADELAAVANAVARNELTAGRVAGFAAAIEAKRNALAEIEIKRALDKANADQDDEAIVMLMLLAA